ncbi:hypothetical protein JHK84_043009 [Glycine max]|nr:hypothetical protein JHK84_043009 [Glycine max]
MPTKMAATSRAPFSVRVSILTTSTPLAGDTIPAPVISEQQTPNLQSLVAAAPPTTVARNLGFRPSPELGLLSHLFVLSMAFGAFFSVAVFSIATLIAFGRLGASGKKLSKVVSEEVPGTLYSLKLSSVELSDLPNNLVISGTSLVFAILFGGCWNLLLIHKEMKDRSTARSRSFRKKNATSGCQHCFGEQAYMFLEMSLVGWLNGNH